MKTIIKIFKIYLNSYGEYVRMCTNNEYINLKL